MRGTLAPGQPWDVVVDLFFYREPEEAKEDEEGAADAFGGVQDAQAGYGGQAGLPAPQGAHTCGPLQPWQHPEKQRLDAACQAGVVDLTGGRRREALALLAWDGMHACMLLSTGGRAS
jgi:hypothetical protein